MILSEFSNIFVFLFRIWKKNSSCLSQKKMKTDEK